MEKSISRIYNKFGKTPFTTAIAYELNDIDKNVYKLLEIVKIIECEQNIKYNLNHNIENIFILMVYIYHSNKILFNLPSMLDNVTLHDNSLPRRLCFCRKACSEYSSARRYCFPRVWTCFSGHS